jgi:catechol 2,3-dioxygenase-like lactoylglutathione lyase family enzyme
MTPTFAPARNHVHRALVARPVAFVPSTDLDRSRQFYEQVLSLPVRDADNFAVVVRAAGVTVRITNVGADLNVQPFTVFGWEVSDVHTEVADMSSRGVTFLRVDGIKQNEAGVWTAPEGTRVAWFKDPDGNTLSLSNG